VDNVCCIASGQNPSRGGCCSGKTTTNDQNDTVCE
jgi:hypothetical protein